MPDLSSRSDIEAQIAEALSTLQGEIVSEILTKLGDPPDISLLDEATWADWSSRYQAAVQPGLERAFIAAVEAMVTETTIGVDWGQVNVRAAEWAKQYGYDLVKGIQDTNRRMLQQAVSDFYEQKWTLGDLEARLVGTYGPVRSEMIAVSETTRAAVEGEKMFVDEIRRMGAEMEGTVQTSEDERVCPICGGNSGKNVNEVGYPPFHPKCRCWVNWAPVMRKAWKFKSGVVTFLRIGGDRAAYDEAV